MMSISERVFETKTSIIRGGIAAHTVTASVHPYIYSSKLPHII